MYATKAQKITEGQGCRFGAMTEYRSSGVQGVDETTLHGGDMTKQQNEEELSRHETGGEHQRVRVEQGKILKGEQVRRAGEREESA